MNTYTEALRRACGPSAPPGRRGGDHRGSAYSRRRRKEWLLSVEAGFGGDGRAVACFWCARRLTYRRLEVDRHPQCGHSGGSYRRDNIVPACRKCNASRCTACLAERCA